MTHRLASTEDFDNIYDFYMEDSANPYLTFDPMEKKDFSDVYSKLLKTATLFIVEQDGQAVATYRLIPKTDRQAHTFYLGGFTIKKSFQGRGFGTNILGDLKTMALRQGKIRIELTVDINNSTAITLYKKAGFVQEGLVKKSYKRSDTNLYYDEFLMAAILE
jgi:RimJ/RimL family protein N-acetyltransferase